MTHITKLSGQINANLTVVLDEELARALLYLASNETPVFNGLYEDGCSPEAEQRHDGIERLFRLVREDFSKALDRLDVARAALQNGSN